MQLVIVQKPFDMEVSACLPEACEFSQVVCAESGAAAEAVAEDGAVVLFFEREAGEAGVLLCQRLREMREDIAFLYASPRRSYALASRLLHAGCVALISKPTDAAAVQAGIRRGIQWAMLREKDRESISLGKELREGGTRPAQEQPRQRPQQAQAVTHIAAFIREHMDEELCCGELAQLVHMNADYLSRLFKKETGHGLKDYIIRQRLQTAQRLLRETDMSVSRVATCVGYCDFSHFSRMYKKFMGRTPQEERGAGGNKVGKTTIQIG